MLKKVLKCIAVILVSVLVLASCQSETQIPEETTVKETEASTTTTAEVIQETIPAVTEKAPPSAEEAPVLQVVSNGSTSFKVIQGDSASDEIAVAAIQLRKALNEATGAKIPITSDLVNKNFDGAMEILVGPTNRELSKTYRDSLEGFGFGIKITEQTIVITATHDDFVPLAVDYFLEHYLENGEYVSVSNGNYAISTAASVTCQGTLADLTNIRQDTNYATVSELVGNVPRTGNFKALQGGCVTEDYAYMAVLNTTDYDTKDAGAYIYKISTKTWKVVKRSGVLMLAHANDITYDPATNRLFVAHCYVDSTQISVIDADTLKLVNTLHTDTGVYALDYHAPTNTFIGGRGKSGTIFFRYSNNGKMLLTTGNIKPVSTQMITQGICRDDKYAYHVMFSNLASEPYNTIIIYDLEKKELAHYVRLSISGQEPENISLVDGAFYVGCNVKAGSDKLDIYKCILYEFDFDSASYWW